MAEPSPQIVEAKLPLWWIIASATAIVFSMGGVFVKLDQLSVSVQKIESKFDAQEVRIGAINQELYEVRTDNRIQQSQIDRVEGNLNLHIRKQAP